MLEVISWLTNIVVKLDNDPINMISKRHWA